MQASVLSLAAQPADGERAEQDHVHAVEDENGKTFGSREQRERRRCREQRRIGLGLGLQNFIGEQCKLDRPIAVPSSTMATWLRSDCCRTKTRASDKRRGR
jgi:hypothetical protein